MADLANEEFHMQGGRISSFRTYVPFVPPERPFLPISYLRNYVHVWFVPFFGIRHQLLDVS